jgi:hypothetical protein
LLLMAELFVSGRIADLVLGLLALEAAVLIVCWVYTRRGLAPADLVFNLASGAFLLLAMRASLTQAGWRAIAGWLGAALAAHLADLYRRWR